MWKANILLVVTLVGMIAGLKVAIDKYDNTPALVQLALEQHHNARPCPAPMQMAAK